MAIDVALMNDADAEEKLLLDTIASCQRGAEPVRVLEAGCGHQWWLRPRDVDLHITGVDLDVDALRIRREEHRDLDEEVVGDLRNVSLPSDAFDVAYCSFVLEHVEGADQVLDTLAHAVRPGGRIIVRVPDGESVYGFLTKHSPHRTHVLYKKYIEGKKHAGEPGHAPYPTVYEPIVSVRGLRAWADAHGFDVEREYGTDTYLRVFRRLEPLARWSVRMIARISRGRLTAGHNNICVILAKAA